MSDIDLRQLSKDYFSGRLQGENPDTRELLEEGCGCPGGPKMVEPEIMGMGPAGYDHGHSHGSSLGADDASEDTTIQDLNYLASQMHGEADGCLTGVVSGLAAMLQSGQVDPSHLRKVWDTLFDIAQSGAGNEY